MSVIEQSNNIDRAMARLIHWQKKLDEAGNIMVSAESEYDKEFAKVLIGLKTGKRYMLDDEIIENPPATIMDKIAKGICWQIALERDKAKTNYLLTKANIETSRALLNAEQTKNRYINAE